MKRLFTVILLFATVLMLNGCDLNIESIIEPKNNIEITTFSARFYVDGTLYHESMESSDKKITPPNVPYKENYIFDGWYDVNNNHADFDRLYTFNVNFNAKFTPDYVTINNKVQTQIISANVKISIYVHDLGFLGLTHVNGRTGVGSGIIIDQVGNDYVVLTNAHVTNIRGRTYMMIDITDYKGVTYTGHKVGYSENLDYDLSMLYFTKKSENLNIV